MVSTLWLAGGLSCALFGSIHALHNWQNEQIAIRTLQTPIMALYIERQFKTREWYGIPRYWVEGFVRFIPTPVAVEIPARLVASATPGTPIAVLTSRDGHERYVAHEWYRDAINPPATPYIFIVAGLLLLVAWHRTHKRVRSSKPSAENPGNQRYERLITRLEEAARRAPNAYRRRVIALALAAYAYITVVLILLVALVGGFAAMAVAAKSGGAVFAKLAFVAGLAALAIARALWVKVPPPEGFELPRQDFPALWEILDRLRGGRDGVPIRTVMVDGRLNAAVMQRARFGFIGPNLNYVVIGLPLMAALSPRQLEAILAHELGHLVRADARMGAWIYRLRQSWQTLYGSMHERPTWTMTVALKFFDWFIPYFNAYSFVMARGDEYQADRHSAEKVGPEIAAESLVRVSIAAAAMDHEFWPAYYAEADKRADPPGPFQRLRAFLTSPYADEAYELGRALAEQTGHIDTHPSLADRLAALGQSPNVVALPVHSAAEAVLGNRLEDITERLDRDWRDKIADYWQQQYAEAEKLRAELHDLAVKADDDLTVAEAWRRASLTERFDGMPAAAPLYQAILDRDPAHPGANYALGRLALKNGDERNGIKLLEQAMTADGAAIVPGCDLIARRLMAAGRAPEARRYEQKAEDRKRLEQLAEDERNSLTANDMLIPHDLPTAAVTAFVERCRTLESIRQVYLVRKKVEYLPESPFFVIGIEWRRWRSKNRGLALDAVLDASREIGFAMVLLLDRIDRRLAKAIRKVDGSAVYRR